MENKTDVTNHVSEHGHVEGLKPDDPEYVEIFRSFMDSFWKTSDKDKDVTKNCGKQVEDAQEIHNYLKKFPADLYLALFHIMQQEVIGSAYMAINHCV